MRLRLLDLRRNLFPPRIKQRVQRCRRILSQFLFGEQIEIAELFNRCVHNSIIRAQIRPGQWGIVLVGSDRRTPRAWRFARGNIAQHEPGELPAVAGLDGSAVPSRESLVAGRDARGTEPKLMVFVKTD